MRRTCRRTENSTSSNFRMGSYRPVVPVLKDESGMNEFFFLYFFSFGFSRAAGNVF